MKSHIFITLGLTIPFFDKNSFHVISPEILILIRKIHMQSYLSFKGSFYSTHVGYLKAKSLKGRLCIKVYEKENHISF